MTLETLKGLNAKYSDKMSECMADYYKAQEAQKAVRKQYGDEYVQEHPEFEKFLGQKVRITSKKHKTSNVGYLEGFELACTWNTNVYPILYKEKKDGTRSKNRYAFYEVPNEDDMIIEIVK